MRLVLLIATYSIVSLGTAFDKTLTGAPKVSCDRSSISLDITSSHGTPSVVFAKGHFNKEDCSFRNESHVVFDFEKCNIRRKREVNPRGIAYSMTVVIQLHPLFITKVDRAYAVRCFYMEADKNVGTELGVDELGTTMITHEHVQPSCSYALHKDSFNGPRLRHAYVGDVVYHVWECPSDVYAMLIHSCIVQDGQGQEQKVVDEQGCSTDQYLMPQLVYSEDLTRTFTASNAFNFPDVSSVQFSCQIKLCFKGDGCDSMTPPKCGGDTLIGRNMNNDEEKEEMEKEGLLTTHQPLILDPIFGEIQDNEETTTEASNTTRDSRTQGTLTTTSFAATNTTDTLFPTPKTIRQFIKDKYGDTVEGSGYEEELKKEERRREIVRRNTDTLDLDISSPELTILEKEMDAPPESPASALSAVSPLRDTVCVPLTAFWLLVGLVLLSLSFILAAICKASSKQGFVQF